MHELSTEAGQELLAIARAAIRAALGGSGAQMTPNHAELLRSGATFVTLYRGAALHGCIGSLTARVPLCEDVAHNAVSAALRDPRAVPLTLSDVDSLSIEISALSPLERLPITDEASALSILRPHVDGVLLRHGRHQGTFLPQVWSSLPDPREFLAELRLKARLPADFWSPDLEFYRYGVQKFVEKPR
jgi:AmmeMemoRadiSam system protein A